MVSTIASTVKFGTGPLKILETSAVPFSNASPEFISTYEKELLDSGYTRVDEWYYRGLMVDASSVVDIQFFHIKWIMTDEGMVQSLVRDPIDVIEMVVEEHKRYSDFVPFKSRWNDDFPTISDFENRVYVKMRN